MKIDLRILIVLSLLLVVAVACQGRSAIPPATPTAAPTLALQPSATLAPVQSTPAAPLSVNRNPISEKSNTPPYEIDIVAPILTGPPGPIVDNFNTWIAQDIADRMKTFKDSVSTAYQQATPDPGLGSVISGLTSDFEVVYQSEQLVSIQVKNSQYMAGAAHPLPYSQSINYSLVQAKILTLDELFNPGARYLEAIAAVCQRELQNNPVVTELDGVAPRPENYRNWNISADGLQVTFDPYQVAAYAAGYITTTVPYSELRDLLAPDGPLGDRIP